MRLHLAIAASMADGSDSAGGGGSAGGAAGGSASAGDILERISTMRERCSRMVERPILFKRKPTPVLNSDTLLTTVDLLDGIPDTTREQCRAYLSHRIGAFFTDPTRAIASSSPLSYFERDHSGGDGTNCGRLAARGAFSRQAAGDFSACPPLDYMVSMAAPSHGGKAVSAGYIQLKRAGDGNLGRHADERAKAGYLMLPEVSGGSGYAQVNDTQVARQHACKRSTGSDGRSYQCSDASHKKKAIAGGGVAVLTERLAFMVTVARFEANADMTVVGEDGTVRLVKEGPLPAIRAGHAAFALGGRLQHACGVSDGPSMASIAASQPHGASSVTFMLSVSSFADVEAQLGIWRAGLPQLLAGLASAHVPASCFYIVADDVMESLRSHAKHGGRMSIEDCRVGGVRHT